MKFEIREVSLSEIKMQTLELSSQRGMGDGDYLAAFQQVIMPIAREVSF